jgi:sortase A
MSTNYFFKKKQGKPKLNLILTNIYLKLKYLTLNSELAHRMLPLTFIVLGLVLILLPFKEEIFQQINTFVGNNNKSNIAPVDLGYLSIEEYISVPTGITELTESALRSGALLVDPIILQYTDTFFISIPSINILRLPVTPNVESTTEAVYQKVLENSLAHFQNTGLPISKVKNNTVIYGHSANLIYNPQRNDPRLSFSFLPEVKIGDKVILTFGDKEYEYSIYRTKVVNPDDLSIIGSTPNVDTITLFTCYPLGNNSQRFVVLGRKS